MELREYAAVKRVVEDKDSEEQDWPASPYVAHVLEAKRRKLEGR